MNEETTGAGREHKPESDPSAAEFNLTDLDGREMTELLDRIPGSLDRIESGIEDAREGARSRLTVAWKLCQPDQTAATFENAARQVIQGCERQSTAVREHRRSERQPAVAKTPVGLDFDPETTAMRRTFFDLNFDEYVALAACGLVVSCWRDVVEPFHSSVTDGEMALMNMRHVERVIELLDLELDESPFTPAAYEQWADETDKDVPHHALAMNVELESFFWDGLGVQLTAAPFEQGEPAPEILPGRAVDDVFGDAFDDDAVEEIWSRVGAAASGRHALVKWALWGATICGNWFRHPNWEARVEHFLAHAHLPESFGLGRDEFAELLRERPFVLIPDVLEWCAAAGIHYSPVAWGRPELPFESPGLAEVSAFERMLASADEDLASDP